MPERIAARDVPECEVPPSKRAKTDSEESENSQAAASVVWPLDDPSEFRPEYRKEITDLGKEKEEFRAFYEVSTCIICSVDS